MVEYIDWNSPGGSTHTLTWFIKNNKYFWFENAWGNNKGIHGPYKDLDELKEAVYNKWNFSKSFDKLFMSNVGKVKPGMDLGEYVVACTPEKEPKKYFKRA